MNTATQPLPEVVERDGALWVDGWVCYDTTSTPEHHELLADTYYRQALRDRAVAAYLRTKETAAKDAEAEAAKQAAYYLRHDDLAWEALALRNERWECNYATWEDVNRGDGTDDEGVQNWRTQAQAARDAKDAEQDAAKQAAYDLRHDELGLEALAIRNAYFGTYGKSWDDPDLGAVQGDRTVMEYRKLAQAARDAKAALDKERDKVAKELLAAQQRSTEIDYARMGSYDQISVDLIIEARKGATK